MPLRWPPRWWQPAGSPPSWSLPATSGHSSAGGQLRPDEGITAVHHSPPVHSGLQTCPGKAPRGLDPTSLATLPPSLPTLCRSWTAARPRGTWDWVNWARGSPALRASALHGMVSPYSSPRLMPSPAQEPSLALTKGLHPQKQPGTSRLVPPSSVNYCQGSCG